MITKNITVPTKIRHQNHSKVRIDDSYLVFLCYNLVIIII